MNDCGGVLVPDGDGTRRVCFVEERGAHPSGRPFDDRELMTSLDHYIPRAMGTDGRLHEVHHYCQLVQGGLVRAGKLTPERRSAIASQAGTIGIRNQPREAKVRGGRGGGREAFARAGRQAHVVDPDLASRMGHMGNCMRWNVRRGKPCTCGQHMLSQP